MHLLFLNLSSNVACHCKSPYCWFFFYTNINQFPCLMDNPSGQLDPILHPTITKFSTYSIIPPNSFLFALNLPLASHLLFLFVHIPTMDISIEQICIPQSLYSCLL